MTQQMSNGVPAVRAHGWLTETATRMAIIVFVVLLSACGGGSNSGGGSQTSQVAGNAPAPAGDGESAGNPFAGTYNGFATITVSGPGAPPQTVSGTISFVIDAQGRVTSDPGIRQSGTGQLNGNSFTVTVPGSRFNQTGMTCNGSVLIHGTITGNTITGTITSSGLSCNGVPIQFNGTFSATRVSAGSVSRAPAGDSVMDMVREWMDTAR